MYYTILILVLFTKLKSISSIDNVKENTTLTYDGIAMALGIWPLWYTKQNMVLSTFPLRLALNKLAAAADGPARQQLLTSLGVDDVKELPKFFPRVDQKLHCLRESDLIMLNKIYVNQSDLVVPSFFADAFKTFGVQAEKIHFENYNALVAAVNQWADSATFKRITNLLTNEDINPRYNMILVNAIHMKPTWETSFDVRMTIMMPFRFHNGTSSAEIRMMTALEKMFFYYNDTPNKFQVLMIHLACDGCKITYFLPHEVSGLPKLMKLLARNPEVMKNAVKKLSMDELDVRLPVMKMKSTINWNKYLKKMGIKKIFDFQSSGLASMTPQGSKMNHFLGTAVQKVFIDIDEFGVFRTPPIERLNLPMFKDTRTIQFVADHPFFFKVELEADNVTHELITGVYYGPD